MKGVCAMRGSNEKKHHSNTEPNVDPDKQSPSKIIREASQQACTRVIQNVACVSCSWVTYIGSK